MSSSTARSRPTASVAPLAVSATPLIGEKILKSHWSEEEHDTGRRPLVSNPLGRRQNQKTSNLSLRSTGSNYNTTAPARPDSASNSSARGTTSARTRGPIPAPDPIITISTSTTTNPANVPSDLPEEADYVTVDHPSAADALNAALHALPKDKASRVLGIRHRRSMEPIPASNRASIASARSAPAPEVPPAPASGPTMPLASLYVVSGLPKSPHTWTLADPDSVLGLHHSEGAVSRWWRPEVLGSTVSPGAGGGGKKKRKGKTDESSTVFSTSGHLSKQEVGKMLSKALKLSFTREVEIIASTLQPASTVHNFTFTLPAPSTPLAPMASTDLLRASVLTANTDPRSSVLTFPYPYTDDPFSRHARPSSAFLGPPSSFLSPHGHGSSSGGVGNAPGVKNAYSSNTSNTITYHGVCLTVWSHADAERSAAIRRTLEASRARKESGQSLVSRVKSSHGSVTSNDPSTQARRRAKMSARGPWGGAATDAETDNDGETDADIETGAISESDFEVASTVGHGPGESTLFLPGDTVFWLPYALTLVSRYPIYDLMRDYLTLSWARFSKDVQSHTLQISKILSHPAPRPGELVRLDASSAPNTTGGQSSNIGGHGSETSLEVVSRFPGGLDFGRGLVDVNFTMWPLFKCLNIDNILTICEIALSPTGRILFFSRHPAMLGIAVLTIKYLVELRGWNGIALASVHSRDAKIYIDDPGPWIMGLATEARYAVRPPPEVCIVDLDINYLNCSSPPPGIVSSKQQRDKYRQRLIAAFEPHYHPDHCVPSEFKEAFPAGRFRPVCKIQAKRGAASTAVADMIKPPEWWHSTRIIQAFDSVLQDKFKKPSLLKRISSFGTVRTAPRLSVAEQHIQLSIRKRATAFVDARDDLETKIGRLSRRLNFLMTESDLWRDKFVTFEQYAEKLSMEASELRTKINKEQKETKRLSSMVTMTAAEKAKLQSQLSETEIAHRDALEELERMRSTMEKMEEERADMIAEVEAQIERALASMAVDMDESDYGSRPSSRMSSRSAPSTLRRPSGESRARPMRSFSTESTLAESYAGDDLELPVKKDVRNSTVEEVAEEEELEVPISPSKKKRFSATNGDLPNDGMTAVDEGISQKSDKIAQRVLSIQRKLEHAMSADAQRRSLDSHASESEVSEANRSASGRTRRRRVSNKTDSRPSSRHHGGRVKSPNSTGTGRSTPVRHSAHNSEDRSTLTEKPLPQRDEAGKKPSLASLRKIPSTVSLSATRPATPSTMTPVTPTLTTGATTTTDDEDTDFQSAYSASPRGSYGSFENYSGKNPDTSDSDVGTPTKSHLDDFTRTSRERASSTATAKATKAPPRASQDTTRLSSR
ncbi:DENN domain-containing protein [Cristinia sonorae]|uniref:DENN domain-containing protein n=1 Tax=Cristinia sonorae TaxID=1940300 RepID=A0A8K0UNV3_9AGAR|nr:DENN domain-containing protein [Cristinia sonorae]